MLGSTSSSGCVALLHTVLYCTVLCSAVLCCAVLCRAARHHSPLSPSAVCCASQSHNHTGASTFTLCRSRKCVRLLSARKASTTAGCSPRLRPRCAQDMAQHVAQQLRLPSLPLLPLPFVAIGIPVTTQTHMRPVNANTRPDPSSSAHTRTHPIPFLLCLPPTPNVLLCTAPVGLAAAHQCARRHFCM
jgi:hypothetical protein